MDFSIGASLTVYDLLKRDINQVVQWHSYSIFPEQFTVEIELTHSLLL